MLARLSRRSPRVLRGLSRTIASRIITTAGPDRYGIVAAATTEVQNFGGNIADSKSFKLRGTFIQTLLVSFPDTEQPQSSESRDSLLAAKLHSLAQQPGPLEGHSIQINAAEMEERERRFRARFSVEMADHKGIVKAFTTTIYNSTAAASGRISVAELQTNSELAPFSATPLFSMTGCLNASSQVDLKVLKEDLRKFEEAEDVDLTFDIIANEPEKLFT